jgi:hypothetical protein
MSAYIAPGELPSLSEVCLHGVASNCGQDSGNGHGACHGVAQPGYVCGGSSFSPEFFAFFFSLVLAMLPPHDEHQTKRTRTNPGKILVTARAGLSRRIRGRLSELPTMPLDILYEVRCGFVCKVCHV